MPQFILVRRMLAEAAKVAAPFLDLLTCLTWRSLFPHVRCPCQIVACRQGVCVVLRAHKPISGLPHAWFKNADDAFLYNHFLPACIAPTAPRMLSPFRATLVSFTMGRHLSCTRRRQRQT